MWTCHRLYQTVGSSDEQNGHGPRCCGAHSLVTAHISLSSETTSFQCGYCKIIQKKPSSHFITLSSPSSSSLGTHTSQRHHTSLSLNVRCPLHSLLLESKLRYLCPHTQHSSVWPPSFCFGPFVSMTPDEYYYPTPVWMVLDDPLSTTNDRSLFLYIHMLLVQTSYDPLAP